MSDNVEVQWETPPASRKVRTNKWAILAPKIKDRPGQWAVIESGLTKYRTQAAVMVARIKAGDVASFTPIWEWEARSSKDKVFVRYIGPNGEYGDSPEESQTEEVQWATPAGTTGV